MGCSSGREWLDFIYILEVVLVLIRLIVKLNVGCNKII